MNPGNSLRIGMAIQTSDGKDLGTIREIDGLAFKVDAPMQPDYWLGPASVMMMNSERITVGFENDHADEFHAATPDEANRPTAIQVLVQMHGEAKALFRDILATVDNSMAGELWGKLQPALEVHEQMEEQHLYGPLQRDVGVDADLRNYDEEHQQEVRQVEQMIAALDAFAVGSADWRTQLMSIRDMLQEHMHEEESEIFPDVEQSWDEERLRAAGMEMLQMKMQRLGSSMPKAA